MKRYFSVLFLARDSSVVINIRLGILLGLALFSGSVWADRLPVLSPLPDVVTLPAMEASTESHRIAPQALPKSAGPSSEYSSEHSNDKGPDFYAGIKAYREGDYRQAERIFEPLHRQQPEQTQITYYLAITQAQLGRFQKAQRLYQEILTLEPQGKAAELAQQGLDYLPKADDLDLPPRFSPAPKAASHTQPEQVPSSIPSASPSGLSTAQDQTAAMAAAMQQSMQGGMQGMSPQDWMAMQMLQGQGQNNGAVGNMNPMSWMMMPGMMGNNGNSGYDPNVMSNMMMNQMMQGFGMGGSDSEQNP